MGILDPMMLCFVLLGDQSTDGLIHRDFSHGCHDIPVPSCEEQQNHSFLYPHSPPSPKHSNVLQFCYQSRVLPFVGSVCTGTHISAFVGSYQSRASCGLSAGHMGWAGGSRKEQQVSLPSHCTAPATPAAVGESSV